MGIRGVGARWGPAPTPGSVRRLRGSRAPQPRAGVRSPAGRPLPGGADRNGGGRAEARAGPAGLLTSAMSCSSRPPAPRWTRSLLRLRWARSHRANPREARSGPDGGQSQPAARRPPLQAWGSRRQCSRPPGPVRSSSSPALYRRRHCNVTPRDALRHFLLPGRRELSGGQ